jgi:hypothetical protein
MNERIRELQTQAFDLCKTHEGKMVVTDEVFEKFAQLLAQECMECVRDVLRDEASDLTYDGADQVQRRIRQVFGIQE